MPKIGPLQPGDIIGDLHAEIGTLGSRQEILK